MTLYTAGSTGLRVMRAQSCSLCVARASTASLVEAGGRAFSTSASVQAKPRRTRNADDPLALHKMGKFQYDDVPISGHKRLERNRVMLKYARIGEWELPKLKEFVKPFQPPTKDEYLRFRFQHYQGEAHPVARKVVLDVPVASLFASDALKSKQAKRKFLLLARERWDPTRKTIVPATQVAADNHTTAANTTELATKKPPQFQHLPQQSISEILRDETQVLKQGQGWIKISCETFPLERQNMKWCSDVFDQMIEEANREPYLEELPLDPRAEMARESKRRGLNRRSAPTIHDFPQEWLGTKADP